MDNYDNSMNSAAPRQPLPQSSNGQASEAAKKFEVAKDSAFREGEKDSRAASLTNNGGPLYRGGPIEGGATGPTPEARPHRMTGFDGIGGSLKLQWDYTSKGLEAKKPEIAVTPHFDWTPSSKGYGPGMKDGKPGVAEGDANGASVTTLDDVKGGAKKSDGSKSGDQASIPGLNWTDENHRIKDSVKAIKGDIPKAPPRQINDLGPSTNEPEQKQKDGDTTVA